MGTKKPWVVVVKKPGEYPFEVDSRHATRDKAMSAAQRWMRKTSLAYSNMRVMILEDGKEHVVIVGDDKSPFVHGPGDATAKTCIFEEVQSAVDEINSRMTQANASFAAYHSIISIIPYDRWCVQKMLGEIDG